MERRSAGVSLGVSWDQSLVAMGDTGHGQKATYCTNPGRDDGGLERAGREVAQDIHILKAALPRMSEEQEMGCEKGEKSRITPKILVQPSGRMELSVFRSGGTSAAQSWTNPF